MKQLKDILEFTQSKKLEKKVLPKEENPFAAAADQQMVDDHPVERVADANGNGDDVFKGTNVKTVNRSSEKHGYDQKKSEEVNERKLTMKEIAKRKEIADAIKREHPEYTDEKKMAIATAQAKKVAEEVEVAEAVDAKAKAKENVDFHHAQCCDYAKEINSMLGTYKKDANKKDHLGDWHVADMAQVHSHLRNAHDALKYASMGVEPPKPIQMKEETQYESILEAVQAHQAQQEEELVESYASALEEVYESLESEEEKAEFVKLLESEDAYDELFNLIEQVEE